MPESTFEFCRLSLRTAQKCLLEDQNDECYDICHQLLEIADIDLLFRAGAHCLLASSKNEPVWHAERAVDQYQELLEEHPGDQKLTRYLEIAGKLLAQAHNDEKYAEDKQSGHEDTARLEIDSDEQRWRFSVPINGLIPGEYVKHNVGDPLQYEDAEGSIASSQRTVSPEMEQGEQDLEYNGSRGEYDLGDCTDYDSDDENEHMEMLMVSGVKEEKPFEGEEDFF